MRERTSGTGLAVNATAFVYVAMIYASIRSIPLILPERSRGLFRFRVRIYRALMSTIRRMLVDYSAIRLNSRVHVRSTIFFNSVSLNCYMRAV